ncbi:ArnT family glycosyltransferase [Butyrivibrio sp. AE3004]|uniref:ArnT family glycosyltransferase n=1 Tax=Butyrivibrio sp. AE3004 TaxID=1506994 RepID=UPI000493F222|nr:glycosyltransferase family 39 protein [Butyrivibrio sp. AE3004]
MKKGFKNVVLFSLMIIFILVDGYMIFHNLGKGYLIQTDEAYHATNAYEMFKQGNWIINTYRYAADYFNSKPPICLDAMVLSFKTFGVSAFAARFPSALSGILTCVLISLFLYKNKGAFSAAVFPALFGASASFFTFHMYRAAEMDAMYNLFFTAAMLSLYMMAERYDLMYVYALFLGLAFMCKGPHAALIFIIGLLYIPKIRKAFLSVKRVALSAVLAAVIPVLWMIKRFAFDGFELLNALFVGEVVDRVSSKDQEYLLPITDFLSSQTVIIFAVLLVAAIIFAVTSDRQNAEKKNLIKEFFSDNYLFIIWAVVPVTFFALTQSYLTWYTYTSQLAMCILTSNLFAFCVDNAKKRKVLVNAVVTVAAAALCLFFITPIVKAVNLAGTGGHPVDEFVEDVQEFAAMYGDAYAGKNAYLISDFRINKKVSDHWEPEYVAPAEMYLDVIPVDGTVDNFLSDPDSILIIDKDLWDDYAGVLTGHVILHDNSYLIFSNDMY